MTLSLHTLHPKKGSRRAHKRVGRGLGSTGTYSGRGVKGQKARSGGRNKLKLKGVRTIMLSTPKKRGFQSLAKKPACVNVGDLNKAFPAGAKVTPGTLVARGLVTDATSGVKILGDGTLTVRLTVEGCRLSVSARAKIEKVGGSVVKE